MDDRAETDEHILTFDIPDEALEQAASISRLHDISHSRLALNKQTTNKYQTKTNKQT